MCCVVSFWGVLCCGVIDNTTLPQNSQHNNFMINFINILRRRTGGIEYAI